MKTMTARVLLSFGLALLARSAGSVDWESVEIRSLPVRGAVHMIQGRGGNIGVSAGEDGVFVIDDQFRPLAPRIRAAIAEISADPVRFVINTHFHRDHTDANAVFGRAGALLVAHQNVRKRLALEEWLHDLDNPSAGLPVVTFDSSVTFHLNGDEVHVFHVPRAHTDGDSIVHFRAADVIHMGDVYFNGLYPFIDVDAGGSVDGTIAGVEAALARAGAETLFIPGHGPLSGRAALVVYRDLLADVRARVAGRIAAGEGLAEIQAAHPSAAYDAQWGNAFIGPERFVESIYRSLAQ